MPTYSITLTETQDLGLQYAALSPQDWINNAVTERARIANDEIVKLTVEHCLDNGEAIPATREEIVAYAFAQGVVKTAAERQAENDALMAERQAEAEAQMAEQLASQEA
jgi:hypothetical protein